VTHGSLMRDIPRLEPDDEFVDQLAQLAAASKPTRGGVVMPVAFQGPAARSLAAAAAVAAIAAGGTLAATQLGHPHDDAPVPPISSVGPSDADDDHGSRQHRTAREADPSETSAEGNDSTARDASSAADQAGVPTPNDHGSPGPDDSPGDHNSGGPGDGPTANESGHGGPGSDGSGGPRGGGGSHDGGGGTDGGGGKDGGGDSASGTDGSND